MIAHLASLLGGLVNGASPIAAFSSALLGLSGVAGIAVLSRFLLSPPWSGHVLKGATIALVVLLAISLTGYFIPLDRYIELGDNRQYYEALRLALLWPTRLLTAGLGQLAWEHANIAGYFFALGLIFTLESIAPGKQRHGLKWIFCSFLIAAVFLTGSRNAWVVLIVSLPLLLIFRPPSLFLKTLGILLLGFAMGQGCLELKKHLLESTPATATSPVVPTVDQHVSGLIERGSMGRSGTYPAIWTDLENNRLLGKGLAETGKPFANMMHEHSIFLAAFRGGGFIALGALLAIIALAAWSALRLFFTGTRWPLLLLAATVVHCTFDQSSILRYSGKHLFLFFWIAVCVPLLVKPTPRPSSPDRAIP